MTNESKTLYIPLYGKAMMSREGLFEDKTAEKIVSSLSDELSYVDTSKRLAIYMAMRAMQYDELTEKIAKEKPALTVIHLGCGLDGRCKRINTDIKNWYDLDFPDVIEVRKQHYDETEKYHMIPSPVTDFSWLEKISYGGEKVLVIAEGLSMYLSHRDITQLMDEVQKRFKSTIFLFDAYSSKSAKMTKIKNPINKVKAKIDFCLDHPETLETNEKIKCIFNNDIILRKYIEKLSGAYKLRFKFMRKFGKSLYRIFGYEITN